MRISDWSSDVCSSDLPRFSNCDLELPGRAGHFRHRIAAITIDNPPRGSGCAFDVVGRTIELGQRGRCMAEHRAVGGEFLRRELEILDHDGDRIDIPRSEEHTSELQSLMSISYAVFCLKNKILQKKIRISH